MLSDHIGHIAADHSTCEKVWKFALVHFALHGALYIPTDSSVPIDLAIDAGLCIARPNTRPHMDMQMEFGCIICEPH